MISAHWKKSLSDLNRLMGVAGAVLLLIYLASGIYSISRNEYGVLTRLGKIINSRIPPGIHYALPWPIDRIQKVPVREARSLTITTFTEDGTSAFRYRQQTGLNSYCITGDNNVVTITFVIQYAFSNPAEYLTGAIEPEAFLRNTIERIIVRTIAQHPVNMILTNGKRLIADQVKDQVNTLLNAASCGIHINFCELVHVAPPASVQASFDDVVNAKIDRERLVSEAESYQNNQLPLAQGNAYEICETAYAYKDRIIAEAIGKANRFSSKQTAYTQNGPLLRRRIWRSTLQQILSQSGQVFLMDTISNTPPALLNVKAPF